MVNNTPTKVNKDRFRRLLHSRTRKHLTWRSVKLDTTLALAIAPDGRRRLTFWLSNQRANAPCIHWSFSCVPTVDIIPVSDGETRYSTARGQLRKKTHDPKHEIFGVTWIFPPNVISFDLSSPHSNTSWRGQRSRRVHFSLGSSGSCRHVAFLAHDTTHWLYRGRNADESGRKYAWRGILSGPTFPNSKLRRHVLSTNNPGRAGIIWLDMLNE